MNKMKQKTVCWTLEKEILLIDFMRERRFLWDPKDEAYYRRGNRDAVLDELAALLGQDERGVTYNRTDVKDKFHNLRTIFNRAAKNARSSQRSGSGADAVYVPRWVHFSRMQFLKDVVKAGPSLDHMEHNPVLETSLEEEGNQDHVDTSANSSPSTSDSSLTTPEAPTPKQRKRRADHNKENDATKMEIDSSILSSLQQPTDPTDTFGKYVAETLKGMGFRNREFCKAEIQQVMLKYMFNDFNDVSVVCIHESHEHD